MSGDIERKTSVILNIEEMEFVSQNSDINVKTEIPCSASKIIFYTAGKWAMKITQEGIFFNKEDFPNLNPDDFANAVIDILEKTFTVYLQKKE